MKEVIVLYCGRIWELYKMIKTSQVRWVFELKKMDSTEEFSELAHIIERKDQLIQLYDNRVKAFIRQANVPRPRYWPFDAYISTKVNEESKLEVEFKYSRKEECEQRVKETQKRIKEISNELKLNDKDMGTTGFMNTIRIESKKSNFEESQHRKSLEVIFVISDPLVKSTATHQKEPILGTHINIKSRRTDIQNAYINNYCLGLGFHKFYLSKKDMSNIIAHSKDQEHKFDARILQVFTSLVKHNGTYYFVSEDDEQIGLQALTEVQAFFDFVQSVESIYCVILIGKGFRALYTTKGQFKYKCQVPIVTVATYSIELDTLAQSFLSHFYKELFFRKRLGECFDNAMTKIGEIGSELLTSPNCCCLHEHKDDSLYHSIERAVGKNVHKVLCHHHGKKFYTDRKIKQHILQIVRLISANKQINEPFSCYFEGEIIIKHKKNRKEMGDFKFYPGDPLAKAPDLSFSSNQQMENALIPGSLIGAREFRSNEIIERPHIVFGLIKDLSRPNIISINIVAEARSGKSNFVRYMRMYFQDRFGTSKYLFHDFCEEFNMNKDSEESLLSALQPHLSPPNGVERNIFMFGKVVGEDHKVFIKLVESLKRKLSKEEQRRILLITTSSSKMMELKDGEFLVPRMSKDEVWNITFRELSNEFFEKSERLLQSLDKIIDSKLQEKISYLDYSNFIRDLKADDKIEEKIKSLTERSSIWLKSIKKDDPPFFQLLAFVGKFKESFLFVDFNIPILTQVIGGLSGVEEKLQKLKKDSEARFLIECEELGNKREALNKGILIRPNQMSRDFFKLAMNEKLVINEKMLFSIQLDYFFLFYQKIFNSILTLKNQFPFLRKYTNREGIFMLLNESHIDSCLDVGHEVANEEKIEYIKHILNHNTNNFLTYLTQIIITNIGRQQILRLLSMLVTAALVHRTLPLLRNQKAFQQTAKRVIEYAAQVDLSQSSVDSYIYRLQISRCICIKTFENLSEHEASRSSKLLEFLIQFEKNMIEIRDLRREIKLLKIKEKEQMKQEEGNKMTIIEKISSKISELEKLSNECLESQEGAQVKHVQRIWESKIYLIIMEIVIHFEESISSIQDPRIKQLFNLENLKKQLHSFIEHHRNSSYLNQMRICEIYLNMQTGGSCKESNFDFNSNELHPVVAQLYKQVWETINPKSLLCQQNIFLFMRARCLMYGEEEYAFVRKDNLIQRFLEKNLKRKKLNLFFLNMSRKNFTMVTEAETGCIPFLTITVDCIKKDDRLKVLFEHERGVEDVVDIEKFRIQLKKINYRYLAIFGSYSHELAKKIMQDSPDKCIISVSSRRMLSLQNYPINTGSIPEIVTSYLDIQNEHRVAEMVLCLIVNMLVNNPPHSKPEIEEKVAAFLHKSKTFLKDWYKAKKNLDIAPYISISINCPHKIEPLCIGAGDMTNLSEKINKIPHNLNLVSVSDYETVGRVTELKSMIEELTRIKNGKLMTKAMIEILGSKQSGKTTLLVELGWFCQTRHLFSLGVFYINVAQVREKNFTLMQYLESEKQHKLNFKILFPLRHDESSPFLLLLLDNLCRADITDKRNYDFFSTISGGPISVVFTSHEDLEQTFKKMLHFEETTTKKDRHEDLLRFDNRRSSQVESVKWKWSKKQINSLDYTSQVVTSLVKLRNRGEEQYESYVKKIMDDDDMSDFGLSESHTNEKEKSQMQELLQKIEKESNKIDSLTSSYFAYDLHKLEEEVNAETKYKIKLTR